MYLEKLSVGEDNGWQFTVPSSFHLTGHLQKSNLEGEGK